MIEGVIRHCTEMEIDRNTSIPTGQSTIAFAFCRLLGFELLPRLKAIHSQTLYRPEMGEPDAYPNLQLAKLVLTRPIDWGLIRQQYDQMVKYATALRLRTAIKTIFLSRYLHNEAFRREIYEGLNVVEQWNSATDFVFLRVPWGTRQQSS
jgi:TnpA family transposase